MIDLNFGKILRKEKKQRNRCRNSFATQSFHGSGPIIRRLLGKKNQNSGVKLGKGTGR